MENKEFIYKKIIYCIIFFFSFIILLVPYPYYEDVATLFSLTYIAFFLPRTSNISVILTNISIIFLGWFFFNSAYDVIYREDVLSILFFIPYIFTFVNRLSGLSLTQMQRILSLVSVSMGVIITPILFVIPVFLELILRIYRNNNLWLTATSIAIMAVIGFIVHTATYIWIDIAWILESSRRFLEGAVAGRDVIDSNHPLIWYLSSPIILLSQMTGWSLENVFWITVIVVTILTLLWMASLVRQTPRHYGSSLSSDTNSPNVNILLLTAFYGCFIASGINMGQREHLTLLFILPYMAMAAARLHNFNPRPVESILVGLVAGIGIAIKPHFLLVVLPLEFVVGFISRKFFYLWRCEVISGTITVVVYWLTAFVFTPTYILEIVPLLMKSRWGEDVSYLYLIRNPSVVILGMIILLYRYLKGPYLIYIFMAAGFGFTMCYFLQAKKFEQHQFPIVTLSIITLVIMVLKGVQSVRGHHEKDRQGPVLLAMTLLVFLLVVNIRETTYWYREYEKETKVISSSSWELRQIIHLLNKYSSEDTFLSISDILYPGAPTLLYVNPRWGGIDICRRHIKAIRKLRAKTGQIDIPRRIRKNSESILADLEKTERHQILMDLANKPVVVLVYSGSSILGSFNILDFYLEDPKFKEIWSHYREIDPINDIRVFERNTRF